MSVQTVLFDFTVDISDLKTDQQSSTISSNIELALRDYFKNLKLLTTIPLEQRDLMKIFNVDDNIIITLRIYHTNGLITINIDYLKNENYNLLNWENNWQLEHLIAESFGTCKLIKCSSRIVPIKRGKALYLTAPDDRLLEYDIDEVVFDEHTPYQHVQILHSISCGNMLVLDGYQNLSEADLIYTETLMNRGKENYADKEILILGGGDGGLLYELLKERPKEVIMLEIDEVVMKACAKYMRSVCGDVLDNMSGPNYKIIVGDCMKSIDQYLKEDRKFDYIFSDLTDIPLESGVVQMGQLWDFVTKILQVSFRLLKPNGKFMTHVIGSVAKSALKLYEEQLNKLEPPVKFTTSKAWVPSFLEEWMFYQVYFDQKQ